ncbi:efflux RND transporter periplasmic adaptor subunit [Phenylobacterium sp.]|uniref:efflux RND transporter periplasmic adaptor subunit n=1 Tax=Phenylobacterium sp. TaxID=1871053 RepID=UPI0025CD7FD2|nr:efflux RND transporter periplasmic adaptor subunit [Phenylobacterium sp.]
MFGPKAQERAPAELPEMRRTRALRTALGLAVALALAACSGGQPPVAPTARAAAEGRLVLQLRTVQDLKPVSAELTTRDMAEARSRIGGLLVSLSVKEGDLVRRGQPIALVRDDRIGLLTGAYDAQAAAAAAEAARAEADLGRIRTLFDQGVYAQARLDQAEAQAKAARAQLSAARAQRAASAELGAQGAVLAPADGRVLLADTPVGSVVSAGQSLARITAGPPVIRISLPEAQARALKPGDIVRLAPEDLDGQTSEGIITEVYPSVGGGQTTADVSAPRLPVDAVGRRVRAWVSLGQRQALVLPRNHVATRYGVDYVALVRADGSAGEIPVQTAPGPSAAEVEILSGLKAGDVVVPAGATR